MLSWLESWIFAMRIHSLIWWLLDVDLWNWWYFAVCRLHVTVDCVDLVEYGFYRHPFDRQFPTRLFLIDAVLVNITCQTKVRDFEDTVIADENVTRRQVSVNELLLRQILLNISHILYFLSSLFTLAQRQRSRWFTSSASTLHNFSWLAFTANETN